MAVHGQSEQEKFVGPRFRTVVPVQAPVPDIDPGAALRRIGGKFASDVSWRIEALESLHHWHEVWTKGVNEIVADHIRKQADERFLAEQTARFETGHSRETDQFQAWLEHALTKGNLETQLAVIAEIPYPPNWIKRYASYVRQFRESTAERLARFDAEEARPPRFVDTGSFFYEIPEDR